ncbi:hypothetical protein RHMOL_Rhmol04G0093400 [Rhododendron molle]|uniref:Uncharacterized protein n=1 Tax=Rhododendron molle TaxID=49168 RepID=A0ACC0P0A8_RHOML|nr:hypothetical protein RHMOL_Rhmol04G0093400 [Rhododendron molle]
MYLAPESIIREEYKARTDVWALGCSVLEMLTGIVDLLFRIGFTPEVAEIPTRQVVKRGSRFPQEVLG